MRSLLDTSQCNQFSPSFDNKECEFYEYAEDEFMEIKGDECGYCKRPNCYRCVADITRPIPLSHSSINDFLTCHYLYWLKKILGIEKRPAHMSDAIKAGKLWDVVKQRHLGANINIQETIKEYEINPIIVAKVRALFHVYKELELTVDDGYELQAKINMNIPIELSPNSFIPTLNIGKEAVGLWGKSDSVNQLKFDLTVTGFYDRKYSTYFCEDKLSSKPEFYLDPYFIQSQCGTYFLADPKLEYVIMEVVRFPKHQVNKRKEETPEEIYKRVYDDVLSRPSLYFIGLDRTKKKYGKKFWRSEFNLEEIKKRYQQATIEILAARWNGNFYKNDRVCGNILPGIKCEMQEVCRNCNISEEMYKIRGK